jgi:hypothetical protein
MSVPPELSVIETDVVVADRDVLDAPPVGRDSIPRQEACQIKAPPDGSDMIPK